jgi:tRNA-specific 2-thiouridylase
VDFTIGQRKGLGVSVGEPRYVVGVDAATATVTIGRKADLEVAGCIVDDVSFVAGRPPVGAEIEVKVRYRASPVSATLGNADQGWTVRFDRPQRAVAPGQSAVFYRGDEVLGGGIIATTVR